MYKPSKIKHPSVRNPGKNKKNGDPAYASGTTPPAPAFKEAATNRPEPPARDKAKPVPAEATADKPAAAEATDGSTTATSVAESHAEPASGKTAEETHKPIVNEDEQKKVVNQSASSAALTDDNTEQY